MSLELSRPLPWFNSATTAISQVVRIVTEIDLFKFTGCLNTDFLKQKFKRSLEQHFIIVVLGPKQPCWLDCYIKPSSFAYNKVGRSVSAYIAGKVNLTIGADAMGHGWSRAHPLLKSRGHEGHKLVRRNLKKLCHSVQVYNYNQISMWISFTPVHQVI